jgi:hypothetical protein
MVVTPSFFNSAKPCAEGCAPRNNISLTFPAFDTPASFNFSAGAPKEARATAGCAEMSTTVCACEGHAAAHAKHTARKVLHKLEKRSLFTIGWMP